MAKWTVKLTDNSTLELNAVNVALYKAEEPVIAFENRAGTSNYPVHMVPVRQVLYVQEIED